MSLALKASTTRWKPSVRREPSWSCGAALPDAESVVMWRLQVCVSVRLPSLSSGCGAGVQDPVAMQRFTLSIEPFDSYRLSIVSRRVLDERSETRAWFG